MGGCLPEISSHYFKQLLGSLCVKCAWMLFPVDQMSADMILHYFRHQPRYRSPHPCDQVHDHFTANFVIECTLDGLDLTSDAANAGKELFLFTNGM
jgi:hypothetical protein